MQAVLINRYGNAQSVFKTSEVDKPTIKPDEVLVGIKASSVNPIECKMRSGYGRKIFTKKRGFEFPVILGNDVCGVIEAVGSKVTEFKIGDEVFTAPEVTGQGSYCEYRAIKAKYCVTKPSNLSFEEAATIPYVALTTWASLVTKAKLGPDNSRGKRVLVHGGSGGIGSFAIQLLKAWGAEVITTCSTAKVEKVKALGADLVIDYCQQDFTTIIDNCDVVFDTVGDDVEQKSLRVLKKNGKSYYVTLVFPALANIDQSGIFRGAIQSISAFLGKKKTFKKQGVNYGWGMFKSNKEALTVVKDLIEEGKIKPAVGKTFPLVQLADAHTYAESGKGFGKIAIAIS